MCLTMAIQKESETSAVLSIYEENQSVYLDGNPCELTQQEYQLLQKLAENSNRAISRQELLRTAWGYLSPGDTRTVDVHVQRLRKKLGFASIETVYRCGYKLRTA